MSAAVYGSFALSARASAMAAESVRTGASVCAGSGRAKPAARINATEAGRGTRIGCDMNGRGERRAVGVGAVARLPTGRRKLESAELIGLFLAALPSTGRCPAPPRPTPARVYRLHAGKGRRYSEVRQRDWSPPGEGRAVPSGIAGEATAGPELHVGHGDAGSQVDDRLVRSQRLGERPWWGAPPSAQPLRQRRGPGGRFPQSRRNQIHGGPPFIAPFSPVSPGRPDAAPGPSLFRRRRG